MVYLNSVEAIYEGFVKNADDLSSRSAEEMSSTSPALALGVNAGTMIATTQQSVGAYNIAMAPIILLLMHIHCSI